MSPLSFSVARQLYLLLFFVGSLIPLLWFWPWLALHGLDVQGLIRELFATRVAGFFGLDVLCSALALLAFVVSENRRQRIAGSSLALLATCCIGVSAGLPLFLYLRQRTLDANRPTF
ncbi:DUF2834 domain-containing protein [Pseudoxanthomonas composti]|uniref:DUF2834 domain-containing protein n=1 Tax=Pseudoxanthomonas composti TaxID=2137479 RepID=A0A4Q1JX78_9GAMM|nr:DUF2834 domain-containing protein [Pseudoxanthomonas composti]RXR07256.1 DUF2834 domain-containing protein [Pseudoxanthomonas composti]